LLVPAELAGVRATIPRRATTVLKAIPSIRTIKPLEFCCFAIVVILGEMRTETAEGGASSVVDSRDAEQLDLSSELVGFELRWDRDDLLSGRSDALLLQLDAAGNELGEKMMGQFVKSLGAVTESTGNKVDAGGKKFSFELLVEMLEKIEWSLDDDDELVMPSIVMHPNQMKNLPSEATPEQEAIMDDLKRRKREELLAQRRSRRLS
jgi:hypothetical protein